MLIQEGLLFFTDIVYSIVDICSGLVTVGTIAPLTNIRRYLSLFLVVTQLLHFIFGLVIVFMVLNRF